MNSSTLSFSLPAPSFLAVKICLQAVEKHPSAAFCSSLVTAAYWLVRLIPRDFASLASGYFSSACEHRIIQHAGNALTLEPSAIKYTLADCRDTRSQEKGEGLMSSRLDTLCINTIRMLSADGVEQARSGHPGLPMGCASVAYVLWTRFLRHDPSPARLARPGSLRPLRRSWFHAHLQPPSPHRIRSELGRPSGLSAVGKPDSGAPGIRSYARCGDHHRPPGAGVWPTPWVWPRPNGSSRPASTARATRS